MDRPWERREVFTPTSAAEWREYQRWAEAQVCDGCGKRRADVARDHNGVALEPWVHEWLCLSCAFPRNC